MLLSLLFLAAIAWRGWALLREARKDGKQRVLAADATLGAARNRPTLNIAGARKDPQPWLNRSLLEGHGIRTAALLDVAWYPLKPGGAMPLEVVACLIACYQSGTARGTQVRDLVIYRKAVRGKKLVFALLPGTDGAHEIVALVA